MLSGAPAALATLKAQIHDLKTAKEAATLKLQSLRTALAEQEELRKGAEEKAAQAEQAAEEAREALSQMTAAEEAIAGGGMEGAFG